MNVAVLTGRLTKDPEVRYVQGKENQQAVVNFTLAVDRAYHRDGDQSADFISMVAWGPQAQFLEKYGKKGMKFEVSGEIRTGSYTNKKTGERVYTTDVFVRNIQFAESKRASGQDDSNAPANSGYTNPSNAGNAYSNQSAGDGFMNIPDGLEEELPFN